MASTTNRTATVLVVKSNKTYYDALYYESSKLAEGKHSLVFLDLVESFNLIENLVSTRDYSNFNGIIPTIVVDAGEVVFLEELFKLLFNKNLKRPVFKLLMLTGLDHWNCNILDASVQSCSDLLLQRAPTQNLFYTEHLARLTVELLEANMLLCHFVVLGNVYGGKGFDFSSVLWSIWNQDCIESKSFAPEGHIGCVYSPDLLNLILQLHSSKSYELPLVITAFEDPTFSFGKFIVEAITNLNGDQAKNTSTVTTDLAKLINNQNHDLSKSLLGRHYIPLPGIDHIGNNFESLWESFINENGLNPVNVLVTGPPRARKSEIAKDVAERLSLQMISIQSAVLFAFEYAETVESANVDSSINHDDLKDSLQAFTSAIEAKIAEQSAAGKKGGKDKNAPSVPAEVKIDVSQLNDALCYSLPDDAIKTALSVQIAFDRKCKRKGFVLDIWERDLYADIDDLCNLRDRFSLQKMTVPSEYPFFTYILEIQASQKLIIDRQLEIMGPQQAKAKEGQAAIKSLETSLETYFNSKISVRELHDGTKVESAKFLESLYLNSNIENSIVNLFPQPLDSLKFSFDGLYTELVEAYKNKFGRNIAWLDHTDINVEKAISLVTNDSSEESKDSSLNLEEQSKPPTANITLSQNDNQTMKYNDFLANTTLPIIVSTMVEIIRGNPEDPIMFLAESLMEESKRRQESAYSDAFKKFMELLNS